MPDVTSASAARPLDVRAVIACVLALASLALVSWPLLAVVISAGAVGVAFASRARLRADPHLRGARLGAGAAILAAGVFVVTALPAALTVYWAVS